VNHPGGGLSGHARGEGSVQAPAQIDLSPIRYKKVAEADEKAVEDEEIIKGYEYEKHHWVTLTDELCLGPD
jgi:hypothetical protein